MEMSGLLLTDVKWGEVLRQPRNYLIMALKMIITPGIILLLLKISGVTGWVEDGRTLVYISFMAVITPCAVTVTQLAQIHRNRPAYAGALNALTTLISVYDDRIEIVSVGGLIPGFHLDDVTAGLSICRNPKLANIFYRLRMIEAYGTGLKKIISAYHGMTVEQLFQVTEKVFKVTLPRMINISSQVQPGIPEHQTVEERITGFLKTNKTITRADVEKNAGVSTATASRILRKMTQSGVLISTGGGKNTKYSLGNAQS